MNRNTKIVLFTSLAINIILIGLILGHVSGMVKPLKMDRHHKGMFKREDNLVQTLPAEKQEEARKVLGEMRQTGFKSFEQSRPFLKEIEAAAAAEKFDEKKFLKAFDNFDASVAKSKKESNAILAKFLSGLSKEERSRLIAEMYKYRGFSKDQPENKEMKKSEANKKDSDKK